MERLFLTLWNRSVAAGWLILAVMVLRLVLRKAPKSVRPWLWALVGVRLVWPRFGQSPLSLIPSAETVPETVLTQLSPRVQSGIAALNGPVNDYLGSHVFEGVTRPEGYIRSVLSLCAAVWIMGMVLMVLWAAVSWLRLRKRVAEAVPSEDGAWMSERIGSPFLLGLLRPRIYLPAGLDGENRTYVLAHERAHLQRRDHWVKPLSFLLLAVYWFQPLVWAAYFLLCRDIELACDERVIAGLGAECKKPYSAALLACSVHQGGLTALAFGEVGVKERVKNVLNYRRPAFWVVAVCIAAVIAAGVCFLTDPVEAKGPTSQTPFYFRDVSQPDEPEVFAAGALLYEDMVLSYMPVDGSDYGPIYYGGDTLALTCAGEARIYRLEETSIMAWDNMYDYFPALAEQEESFEKLLTDHNDLVITARLYRDESGEEGPSVWTIQKENGGGQRWWLYVGGRLFALIYLEEAFPFMANGVLWTYAPGQSTLLPVRFDVEGGVSVWAGPGGQLFLDPRGENPWTGPLLVEEGQTIYWKPPLDQDGKPVANTGLHYSYTYDLPDTSAPDQEEDTLTIRPVMDYTGLYGGVTCGVSNNWLGAASSQSHATGLTVDSVTGEMVVSAHGKFPYLIQMDAGIDSASGTAGPVATEDAQAE